MRSQEMKAILLSRTEYSEADYLLTALLQNGSKKSFFARGARKSKKRFPGGVLEPSHFVNLRWQEKGLEKLSVLQDAILLSDFRELRLSYERLQICFKILDRCLKVAKEDLEMEELFHLLGNTLKVLCNLENLEFFLIHFDFRLLQLLGILPENNAFQFWADQPIGSHSEIKVNNLSRSNLESQIRNFYKDSLELDF